MQAVVFQVGAERFAIDTTSITEVIPCIPARAVPAAPPALLGVIEYRGAVVPVLDGKHQLERSLPPLLAAVRDGELLEVLVADDGSSDGSGDYARSLGARVVTTERRASGPSHARNLAAAQAEKVQ